MQNSAKNLSKGKKYTVLRNAIDLKLGRLSPEDLPTIRVWRDSAGKIWTLDHRRLAAFRMAGVKNVPVQWATTKEVAGEMWKMSTKTHGKPMRLKSRPGKSITVQ